MRYEELREQILEALVEDRPLRKQILQMLSRFRSRIGHYRQAAARLRTLLRMSTRLQATDDLDEQLNLICNVIINIKTYRRAVITLLDDDLSVLGYGHAGVSEEEATQLKNATPLSPVERRKILSERYRISHSYFVPYPETEQIFDREVGITSHLTDDEFVNWHPRDMLFVPLYGPRKRLVGTLSLDDPFDGRRPTARTLKLLELFGSVAAATIAGDRLHRELEHAKSYLSNMIENSADMIIATDTKGRIIIFNHASELLFGYSAEEIHGQAASKLYTNVKDFHAIELALRTDGFISGFETTATTKNGEEIPISLSANILLDSAGNLIGTEGVAMDLREHLEMDRKLIAAEKQKTLTESAVGVGHEINNPLETIIAAVSIAMQSVSMGVHDPDLLRDKLKLALKQAHRISTIVSNFNKLAHGSGYRVTEISGEVTMVDFAASIGDCCPLPERYRILIADDEEGIRELLSEYLRNEGFWVDTAADGEEAVSMATTAEPYDVVISDIMMPRKTGYEVYSEILEIRPQTKIVLMTGFGYDPTHSLLKARKDGLKAVLFKPFEPKVVRDKIMKLVVK